jgi:glutamate/aspartate transport system substrate-binding protein
MSHFARRVLGSLCFALITTPTLAQTPSADTLSRIRETRSITLGVRDAARPFSYLNELKQPVGYSVDLCLAAVEDMRRELKLPELKVNYKVLSGAERIPKLLAQEIDLECGSTTNTKARQETVDFSYTIFVAGMRVLIPKNIKVDNIKDLQGLQVAVSKGTTSEKLFSQIQGTEVQLQLQTYASNAEAYKALKEGKARAFPQDDSLLMGMAANDKALDSLVLSRFALSVEPYAIMMRKNDAALQASVDRTLHRLYKSGEINTIYKKWFDTETLSIPRGRLTQESFVRPNKEPGVALMLGYSL